MAGNVVWGLDIGKSSLKAVKMQNIKGDLEILEIEYIPYQLKEGKEEEIELAIADALAELMEVHGFKGESVAVSLPGRVAFSRFIQLPPVDPKKMGDIVRYEAQQQIPFPIDDVVWSYHSLQQEYEAGEEVEVGIFAVKKEIVQDYLDELAVNNIDPDIMTIVPLALFNFIKYDMDPGDDTTLIIDIGADHTDLIVLDGEKFWIRNLPTSAKVFTQAIKKKLKLSYPDAERLKMNLGRSKKSKKILKILKPEYKNLIEEINRSIGFYKSQASDVNFKKVLLSGSGSKAYALRKYIQKDLKIPVQRISRLSRINIATYVDVDILRENIESFGVAIGLALQGLEAGSTTVNLLPEEKVKAKEEVKKRPYLIASCAVFFVMILAMVMLKSGTLSSIEGIEKKLTPQELGGMTPAAYVRQYNRKVQQAQNLRPLQVAINGMLEISRKRQFPLKVLESLDPVFKENGDLGVIKTPALNKRSPRAVEKPVVQAIKSSYANKIWLVNLLYEDKFSFDLQKGPIALDINVAVSLEGKSSRGEAMKEVVEKKLYPPLKESFKEELPDPTSDAFKEAFNPTFPPGDPKRFAIHDSEDVRTPDSVIHPIEIFLLTLKMQLNRGEPKVEIQEPPKRGRRNRRRRR